MFDENSIISKLAEIIGAISGVAEVHEGIPATFTKYSAVTIIPVSWSDSYADLRDTAVEMQFKIGVYVQIGTDPVTSQQTLRSLVKDIREELGKQSNIDLGGLIDYSQLTDGEYSFVENESGLYSCLITYKAIKRFNRN